MHTQPEPDPHHPGFAEDPRPPIWLGLAFFFLAALAVVLFALVVRQQAGARAALQPRFVLTLSAEQCPRPVAGQRLIITAAPATQPGADFDVQCQLVGARQP